MSLVNHIADRPQLVIYGNAAATAKWHFLLRILGVLGLALLMGTAVALILLPVIVKIVNAVIAIDLPE